MKNVEIKYTAIEIIEEKRDEIERIEKIIIRCNKRT